MIKWEKMNYVDTITVSKIADRALKQLAGSKMNLTMDISAVHVESPLRLTELLEADDFNFFHDVCGIIEHIDRNDGTLKDFFLPRFTV